MPNPDPNITLTGSIETPPRPHHPHQPTV